MRQRFAERRPYETRRRMRPGTRLKAILCRPGPDEVTDNCLLVLSREVDIEQVATLAEAMQRCLAGKIDILFVNTFSISSRELTALLAFRSLAPRLWMVALAPEEMKTSLITMGIADEVLVAASAPAPTQPRA